MAGSNPSGTPIDAVVFDLGGVLIDWNPRHLYAKLFPGDEAAMEKFLSQVVTLEWNRRQDAGRCFAEGVAELQARHPHHARLIEAYMTRWEEMLGGVFDDSVAVLAGLRRRRVPLYGLTNWARETFPIARRRFDFLDWFEGIVVSGEEGVAKPDPGIFRILLDRYALDARNLPFIDDTLAGRFSGYFVTRGGVDINRFDGERVNDDYRYGVRGRILYTPTDSLEFLLSGDLSRTDNTCCIPDIIDYKPTGPATLIIDFGDLADSTGRPLPDGGAADGGADPFDRIVDANETIINLVEIGGVSLEMNLDLPAAHTLTWLSAYRYYNTDSVLDGDFSNYDSGCETSRTAPTTSSASTSRSCPATRA